MSVTGSLTQIAPHLLAKVEKVPSMLDIFWQVFPMENEEPKLENLDNLSAEHLNLLQEIVPIPTQVLHDWTLEDLDVLVRYKARYREDYVHVLPDIPQIIELGKNKRYMEIGKEWHVVSFLFRGDRSNEFLSLLTSDEEKNWRVNPILCGREVKGHRDLRHVGSSEVQIVANALEKFPQDLIRQRFQQILSKRPHIYPYRLWMEQHYEGLLEICRDIKKFYRDAAIRGDSILVKIG